MSPFRRREPLEPVGVGLYQEGSIETPPPNSVQRPKSTFPGTTRSPSEPADQSRRRSTFRRRTNTVELLEDVREIETEFLPEHLTSTSPTKTRRRSRRKKKPFKLSPRSSLNFVPGQSCRLKDPGQGSPSSRGMSTLSNSSSDQSRLLSPSRTPTKADDIVPRHESGPRSPCWHSQYGTIKEKQGRCKERSKFPFLRQMKCFSLVEDTQKGEEVGIDYATRDANVSECSVVEVVLDSPVSGMTPSLPQIRDDQSMGASDFLDLKSITTDSLDPPPTYIPGGRQKPSIRGRKSILMCSAGAEVGNKQTTEFSEVESISTGTSVSDLQLQTPPGLQKQKSLSRPGSLRGGMAQTFQEKLASSVNIPVEKEKNMVVDTSMDLSSLWEEDDDSWLCDSSVLLPLDSIALGRHSHLSELSAPPTPVQRRRSLGDDSVEEIQNALRKVQDELHNASKSGRKVNRISVMKKILEVADTIQIEENLEIVQREASWSTTKTSHSLSDLQDGSDTSFTESDDASSFTRWISGQEEKEGDWSPFLDMFGLANAWYDNIDVDSESSVGYAESKNSDRDDPKKLLSTHDETKLLMRTAAPEDVSAMQPSGQAKDTRQNMRVDEARKRLEIAEEEKMMRELEELDQKIRKEADAKERAIKNTIAEKARSKAFDVKSGKEESTMKQGKLVQQAKFDADALKQKSGYVKNDRRNVVDASRSRRMIKEEQERFLSHYTADNLHGIEKDKRNQRGAKPWTTDVGKGSAIATEESNLRNADPHVRNESHSSIVQDFSSDSGSTFGENSTNSSWHWRHLSRSLTLERAATKKNDIFPQTLSSDSLGDSLSLGSIESHQFYDDTGSVLQNHRRLEDGMGLQELGMAYTLKMARR